MKVAVFAGALRGGGGRSVGVSLIDAMGRVLGQGNLLAVIPPLDDYRSAASLHGAHVIERGGRSALLRLCWEWTVGRRAAHSWGADWVVALGNVPVPYRRRSGVLLHDPHLFYPKEFLGHLSRSKLARKRALRAVLAVLAPRMGLVMAQTPVAARRIEATFGISGVLIVPNAVSAEAETGRFEDVPFYELPDKPFRFLALTRYYRRKGLERIADAYERHGDLLSGTGGIFTFDPGRRREASVLHERIKGPDLASSLVNIGPVPQRHLRWLYGAVDAVVLPTLLESFSGTYIEAMAFGVPIITSDRDFARDVCGDAAVYFDPADPAALAAAVRRVADDSALRESLVRAGRDRVLAVSSRWDDSVRLLGQEMRDRMAR